MLTNGLAAEANERDRSAFGGSVDFWTLVETPSLLVSTSIGVELIANSEVLPKEGASELTGILMLLSSFGRIELCGIEAGSSSASASSSGASSGIFVCLIGC